MKVDTRTPYEILRDERIEIIKLLNNKRMQSKEINLEIRNIETRLDNIDNAIAAISQIKFKKEELRY